MCGHVKFPVNKVLSVISNEQIIQLNEAKLLSKLKANS